MQWIIWQRDDPKNRNFDRQAAVRDLPVRLSPYTEQAKIKWRQRLSRARYVVPDYAVPTAVYALLLIPLLHRRWRWSAVSILLCCIFSVFASYNISRSSNYLFPLSHSYLDDYVYIDDVDMVTSEGKSSKIIAAYDPHSFEGNLLLRIIAFSDGHVVFLRDDQAKPLFEAQGLEYPVSPKSQVGD